MKPLVLFYSRTGNTRYVAELLAKKLNADIEEIIETKSRKGTIGYMSAGKDAMMKKTAKIKLLSKDPADYDTIFIGQPVWAFTMIPAIRALIKKYDFSGKKVVLFCTMNSSGSKGLFIETRKCLLSSDIIAAKAFVKPLRNKDNTKKMVEEFVAAIDDNI